MSMKSNNIAFAAVKKEDGSEAPPAQPMLQRSETQQAAYAYVKEESQELTSKLRKEKGEFGSEKPQFLRSVDELGNLSNAIHVFKRRLDELQKHLDFIENAIATRSSQLLPMPMEIINDNSDRAIVPQPQTDTSHAEEKEEGKIRKAQEEVGNCKNKSELEYLCEMMCSRGLRKYIVSHLSEDHSKAKQLREEAPAALKCAPKPEKLVFDCIGRFFLQGSKAFSRDSPMIPARQASVLVLEFFLLSGCSCTDIEPSLKEEADLAAISWRKRLISEGGVSRATHIDARGLLLFLASFGIPSAFSNEELRDLIRLSNSTEISDALRHSQLLLARIPDIIEGMLNNCMSVEAVDVAYTFGFEEKFPPQRILTSFLRNSKEAWKRTRREGHSSPTILKEANEKQLAALKSVIKCLEDRKIDPAKLLPGWRIKENIVNLVKEIADLDSKVEDKMTRKRKADEIESSNQLKSKELKWSIFTAGRSPLMSSPVVGMQEHRVTTHVQRKSSYDGSMAINLLDGGLSGYINSYPASLYVPQGPGAVSLPENGVESTGSFSRVQGEMEVHKVRQMMNNNALLYGRHGIGDAAFRDRSIGQSFISQPASKEVDGLFGLSPSLEGFLGLPKPPSTNAANQSTASDLYRFADTVLEGESYQSSGSHKACPLPAALPAHSLSYLYN